MNSNDLNSVRLQLLALGYHILPNKGKVPAAKGWNRPDFITDEMTPARVESWLERFVAPTIGVIVNRGLCISDIDVDDILVDRLMDEISVIAPEVFERAPTRFGGGTYKIALFCRTEDDFVRVASRKYNGHCVEIFGGGKLKNGNFSRQFGVYGPHSFNSDGSVAVDYAWSEGTRELADLAVKDLPLLSRDQALEICGAFERLAEAVGWVAEQKPEVEHAGAVYDIDEDSRFNTDRAGAGLTYAELCDAYEAVGELRCASSFMTGRDGRDRSRCWVYWSKRHDCVAVYVYGDEASHFPVDKASRIDRIIELTPEDAVAVDGDREPAAPDKDADVNEKAAWLLQTRGYLEGEDAVVRLYDTSLDCRVRPAAFERRHRAWFVKSGTSARPQLVFATELWAMSPARVHLAGVRMRPDRPFPLFEEDGKTYKNVYRRPRQKAGGNVAAYLSFAERFVPDVREREWLFDWMAHKLRKPEIPGTAVIFVADTEEGTREGNFGTGRGLMFQIAHRLYGEDYTVAQSFSMLEGTSSQSTFNDWIHGAVLATVDEAKTSPTSHRRGERNATYEVLKDIVDPAPKRTTFRGKYRQAFDGMSYCSFWVASNHANAVAIPLNDRRFTVLRNGRGILPEEAREIAAWTADRANIGALAAWLGQRDLSGFDMFEPLETAGKTEMAELSQSDVEEVLQDIMNDEKRGLVFTKGHLERVIEHNFNGSGQYWRGEFQSAWHNYCVRLQGAGGGPKRVRILGTQRKLFCFRNHHAKVAAMPEAAIQREIAKWGGCDPEKGLFEIKDLS